MLELAGLPVPDCAERVEQAPAGQLFLRRARQVGPNREITAVDYPAIAEIRRLTDGLPLALLLAADWLRALNSDELRARLAAGLDLLTSTLQNLPERQRSVRTILARAAEPLASDERAVLRRLSVFCGPFDQGTASAVVSATPLHLLVLRDSGLLAREEGGCYRLPELVRRYAAERLAARPTSRRRRTPTTRPTSPPSSRAASKRSSRTHGWRRSSPPRSTSTRRLGLVVRSRRVRSPGRSA